MSASYLLIVALVMPMVTCYPQSDLHFNPKSRDGDKLEKMLKMIAQLGGDDDDGTKSDDAQMQSSCATDLYVMAFTSSDDHSGSDDLPILKVYLTDGQVAEVDCPNKNGVDEQAKHKGDFWRFTTANLGLTGVCLTKDLISSIVVVSGGKDTWKIGSVVTILRSAHEYTVVTGDIDVETVIDSNQSQAGSLTAITLTKTYD